MSHPSDQVFVTLTLGPYVFEYAFSPGELDQAVKRAKRCSLSLEQFLRQKLFGPDPEARLGIASDWALEARLSSWRLELAPQRTGASAGGPGPPAS